MFRHDAGRGGKVCLPGERVSQETEEAVCWLSGEHHARQSGALSLVQIHPDTVLSLVELYYAGAKVYAITTHLKTCKMPPLHWGAFYAFQCVVMA